MKPLFLLFAFLISLNAYGQKENISSIELKGIGTVKMLPDQGNLNVDVLAKHMEMNKAIAELDKKASEVYKLLEKSGFKKEEIKTTSYNVNKHIVYKNGEARDSGYIGRQHFQVEFPYKKGTISKIITAFADKSSGAQFSFSFSMSDSKMKEIKELLIKDAVRDALEKAVIITEASNASLGDILEIKYGAPDQTPVVFGKAMHMEAMDNGQRNSHAQGFEIREMEFSDSVWIKWRLQ